MVEALMRENGIGVAPAGSGKTVMGMRYIYEKGKAKIMAYAYKRLNVSIRKAS